MYDNYDISKSKKMSFRNMDDSIASLIWQQLDKSGSEVIKHFEDQFYPMNCIPIGLDGYTT
jgi:hypothetical protein